MNYYRRYIGDYARDTALLSLAEHGAYALLLDHYYASESPLPLDMEDLYRIARTVKPEERKAVDKVILKYFTHEADGFHNTRADAELDRAKPAIDAAKRNGMKGGRPRKNPTGQIEETQQDTYYENPSGCDNPDETEPNGKAIRAGDPTTNHHPPTASHHPPTANRQPTPPVEPPPQEGRGEARASKLPHHWRPSLELEQAAFIDHPDWTQQRFELVLADFKDHWISKGERREDWDAAWRKWVRNQRGQGTPAGRSLEERNLDATAGWAPAT